MKSYIKISAHNGNENRVTEEKSYFVRQQSISTVKTYKDVDSLILNVVSNTSVSNSIQEKRGGISRTNRVVSGMERNERVVNSVIDVIDFRTARKNGMFVR